MTNSTYIVRNKKEKKYQLWEISIIAPKFTIKNFADAEETEILKIDGIGKVLAKKLHKILNEKYGGNA